MNHRVVVWDPDDQYWEGAVVDGPKGTEIEGRGGATLPCIPDSFRFAGISGYAKRSWGAGWPLDTNVPSLVCPLTIFVPGGLSKNVAWKARLVPSRAGMARAKEEQPFAGVLRLQAGEGRNGMLRTVVVDPPYGATNMVEIAKLGPVDERGGWIVGGQAGLAFGSLEGCVPLALYGFAPGMRVAWLAATLTP